MLLAESDAERRAASEGFGAHLFALSGGAEAGGKRWGLLWGAEVVETEPEARALLGDAKKSGAPPHPDFGGPRALLMLDRWAGAIAQRDGEGDLRGQGVLRLRTGPFCPCRLNP